MTLRHNGDTFGSGVPHATALPSPVDSLSSSSFVLVVCVIDDDNDNNDDSNHCGALIYLCPSAVPTSHSLRLKCPLHRQHRYLRLRLRLRRHHLLVKLLCYSRRRCNLRNNCWLCRVVSTSTHSPPTSLSSTRTGSSPRRRLISHFGNNWVRH